MKNKWLIAIYKINEVKRVESNLANQNFEYYLPKITTNNSNSNFKEVLLFPGYIFVNASRENYSSLKYTLGIKDIIKFGGKIPFVSNEDINSIRMIEEKSKKDLISPKIQIDQKAFILKGSLRGIMVKICSLPSKKRVEVLLTFLGSMRRITVPINDLKF